MRIVPGLRELDDYDGLPGARRGATAAKVVSFLLMSAFSIGASFGALAAVKEVIDRALGPGSVSRAMTEFDPENANLYGLLNADWPGSTAQKTFAGVKQVDFGRPSFGQRKSPPGIIAEAATISTDDAATQTTTGPTSKEIVEAFRARIGQPIRVVEPER